MKSLNIAYSNYNSLSGTKLPVDTTRAAINSSFHSLLIVSKMSVENVQNQTPSLVQPTA